MKNILIIGLLAIVGCTDNTYYPPKEVVKAERIYYKVHPHGSDLFTSQGHVMGDGSIIWNDVKIESGDTWTFIKEPTDTKFTIVMHSNDTTMLKIWANDSLIYHKKTIKYTLK